MKSSSATSASKRIRIPEAAPPADTMEAILLKRMLARRSTPPRHLGLPGPGAADIELLARIAARAPDHLQLRPFRFVVIEAGQRGSLADVFEAAEEECDPALTTEQRARVRERAHHAPVLLAVIARVQTHELVPMIEQHASAGAALGYLLLAADLMGYGAMEVSGRRLRTPAMRNAFQLAEDEEMLSFIGLGTARKTRSPAPEPEDGLLRIWRGPVPSPSDI